MMKVKKNVFSLGLVFVLIFSISGICFAGEYNFSGRKVAVDSNSWTYIGIAKKDSTTAFGTVMIADIYDANGNTCNYSYVKAKANNGGSTIVVKKGSSCDLPIPSGFQAAGSWVSLYCMGNNPSLDCMIKGFWNVY